MADEFERLRAALADRYALERIVGRGGMATVYLAEDIKHRRRVAVKVLRPEVAEAVGPERFLREIEIAAQLAHPHILPLHDSGGSGGFLYYVMPYVEGETLREVLQREQRVPLEDALRIAHQVAGALAHAHRQNFVHRDVKPENVLLSEGHALVADFGIGKAACAACEDDHLTIAGVSIGTPAYMSPEQAMGEPVDARSDIYSLACVVFEMLTGNPPYRGPTPQATLMKHTVSPIPSVRDVDQAVPAFIDEALQRALGKEPEDRHSTVAEFAEALGTLSPTAVGVRGTAPTPIVRERWLPPWRAAALGGVAAVVAMLGAWWLASGPAAGAGRVRSLAVLPLANLSADSGQVAFVDGMHDALIAEVARIRELAVISRTSVMRYRDTATPIAEIARELDVDAVLEGSVFRSGDSVRITAQLIAVAPERHLWSGSYERELRYVLGVHAEVAEAIAGEIEAELRPGGDAVAADDRSVDPVVVDLYLEGRFHASRGSVDGFRLAMRSFERAIHLDPQFAPAYSAIALSIHLLGFYGGMPRRVAEPRAKAMAQRALALDSGLAEARAVLAGIRAMYEWDFAGAERDYRLAVALDPSSPIARQWHAYFLTSVAQHDEAVAEAGRALALDPFNPTARVVLADQLVHARRYGEAIIELERVLEQAPDFRRARGLLEDTYALAGDYDAAVAVRRADPDAEGGDPAALSMADRGADASRYWRWRLAELERTAALRYVPPHRFARVLAALGESEAALKVSPYYDSLRSHPRFRELLERVGLSD
jgi:serine/threonine-protein kinase